MFGIKTVVVGNMPHTTLAKATLAIAQLDGNKIDRTEIIRVYEWAWLGDWMGPVLALNEVCRREDRPLDFDEMTAGYPTVRSPLYDGYPEVPIIAGAEQAENFFLDLQLATDEEHVDRARCAWVAAQSLIIEGEDDMEFVYGVILTEECYTKENSKIMLRELFRRWNALSDGNLHFQIRVFVVKEDGVEMHKL